MLALQAFLQGRYAPLSQGFQTQGGDNSACRIEQIVAQTLSIGAMIVAPVVAGNIQHTRIDEERNVQNNAQGAQAC